MKLIDRQSVEGTERPVIYIGHRQWRDKDGRLRKSKPWSAEWFLHGKQEFRTLKTGNKVAAIKAAHELHRKICTGEPTESHREVRVQELVDRYMTLKRGEGLAPKSLSKYEKVLNDFAIHCDERGTAYGSRVSEDDFWTFEMDRKLTDKTRYDRRVIVLQLMKWATVRAEELTKNPLRHIRMKKPEWKKQPCFNAEQVAVLLNNAPPGIGSMITFLAYTGCRFGEMRDLHWSDIDFTKGQHGFVTVSKGGSDGKTKSKRSRRIPLHPTLSLLLQSMPHDGDRVFHACAIGGRADSPVVDTVFLRKLKVLCADCGLPRADKFKTHSLRHFFASMLARENVSYRYALAFMGQSSSKILDLYYTMFDKDAERAIATIQISTESQSAA